MTDETPDIIPLMGQVSASFDMGDAGVSLFGMDRKTPIDFRVYLSARVIAEMDGDAATHYA
jgi:hypothetical protein